jgi:hypothetical protein
LALSQFLNEPLQAPDRRFDIGHVGILRVIAKGPLEDDPAVGDLSSNDSPRDFSRPFRVIGPTVLRPSHEDVA